MRNSPFTSWLFLIWENFIRITEFSGYSLVLIFQSVCFLPKVFEKRSEIVKQMYAAGAKSFLVVSIVAFFTGMILSLQTGLEMKKFGLENLIGQLVVTTLTREMSSFTTGVVLIASVGSSIAAELSTMKVSEEIDALEMLLINPVKFLVMPRVVALAIMFPVVSVYFTIMGIIGGGVVSYSQLSVEWDIYWKSCLLGLKLKAVYVGLLKSFLFGTMVAAIACANGLKAENGVAGVGQATRNSVIASFVMVLITGYYITAIFYGTK